MKIVIPSYKRANDCKTALYLPNAIILANESEVELYRKNYKNEVVGMPDEKGGNMARVRNFILDKFKGEDIVMVDDDIKYFGYWENKEEYMVLADYFYEICERNFEMTRDLKTVLWGVNLLTDKKAYREYSPFSFSSIVFGSCMGICKENDIRFDERLGLKEDCDFSVQVLNKYRKILRLNKFHYWAEHKSKKGGCADYRSVEKEKEQMMLFVKKWGRNIVKFNEKDINPIITVPIRGI